jgi:hypothetical protein
VPTVVLPDDTATLHKYDGTDFAAPVAVQKLTINYSRNYPEIIVFANNTRGFSEIGDDQDYINSFTLETYNDAAARQIQQNVAREASQGLFTLRVPDLATGVDLYLIRFFGSETSGFLEFTREIPRRRGFPALHVAEVTEIEVLDHDTE